MYSRILVRRIVHCLLITVSAFTTIAQASGNNILVIIADDLGIDMLSVYGKGAETPPTPNIDRLKNSGVMFRNAWSNPYCSPTRATIQVGKYGFRTGVGAVVSEFTINGLPLTNPAIQPIPRVLNAHPELGYKHAAIGKWHLSNTASSRPNRKAYAPNDAGWSYFSGNWSFMGGFNVEDGKDNYFSWQRLENGNKTTVNGGSQNPLDPQAYVTTVNVDDAIRWVDKQTGPWLLYLAFNSPHFPYHAPPPALLRPVRDITGGSTRDLYKGMIEAMDTEIGRLLNHFSPAVLAKTTIIFLGDNGTPKGIPIKPFDPARAKETLYEGGINVPLIISGADVKNPNRESQALVNTTDLYATMLDLAGVDMRTAFAGAKVDSISLKPIINATYNRSLRKFSYAEFFQSPASDLPPMNDWQQAIRNEHFKLIRNTVDKSMPALYTQEFYELASEPPFEKVNLLASGALTPTQQQNLDILQAQLGALVTGTEHWSISPTLGLQNIINFLLD